MNALNASVHLLIEVTIISMSPPPPPLNAGETYHSLCKTLIEGREEGAQYLILNKNRSKYFAMMPN